jgi:DNA-binding response OmpR family regulator
MTQRTETILLLDHHAQKSSVCASALASLGYSRVCYADFRRYGRLEPVEETIDAVVAVWTDAAIDFATFLRVVGKATELPRAKGALIVSPFSTEENASLLRHCGARAWIRYPFLNGKLDRRLRYLIEGDGRQSDEPVAVERRHEPVYPVALSA